MPATSELPRLRTLGEIAVILGVPLQRVAYILRTRPYIQPAARAGILRVFDLKAVAEIRQALNGIDARKLVRAGVDGRPVRGPENRWGHRS